MANSGATERAPKLVFSTDQLPLKLDERARVRAWREVEAELFGSLEVSYADDRPFWARAEYACFGMVGIGQYAGTFDGVKRPAQGVAQDGRDEFALGLNRSSSVMLHSQRGEDALLEPGAATLLSHGDAGSARFEPGTATYSVSVPRRQLLDIVPDAEDLVARVFDHRQPAIGYLTRYLDLLLDSNGLADDPQLASQIETTLVDLLSLALGAGRDAAHVASMRGLRAARLQAILAEIRAGFSRPDFSVHQVAARLGLSAGYVQELLYATGINFSERVLELRLQKARSMLTSRRYARVQVSQIAYACGFNQASYFNRCFRRRFGIAPNAARRGARSV